MSENQLKDKNILFISVKFFNYEHIIKSELEGLGAKVDFYDERPSNSFYAKAMIRINKGLYSMQARKYYLSIIKEIRNNKYDYFFLIKGEIIPVFFLDFLRENNPSIQMIYYTYDSFKNNPNGFDILDYFERKFTFDTKDAIDYDMNFRPLFFSNDYHKINSERIHSDLKYNVSFIGTAHSDRYTISEKVKHWIKEKELNMYAFYFSPSKLLFKYNQLTKKDFKNFDASKISFESLSHKQITSIYRESQSILDINHPGQKGLTMRTFESLGAGCKLITTNEDIKRYPFYNENNVCVIDRKNIKLNCEFFKTDFQPIKKDLNYKMSINGWIEDVFYINDNYWNLVIK